MPTARRTLYVGGALIAVVLLLTGAQLSTALTVVLLTFMVGMHLGGHGHGGHGGHGGTRTPSERQEHQGHGSR